MPLSSQHLSIDSDVLPPPSITRSSLLGTLWFGAAFTTISVTARLIIRRAILKRLQVEDYLVIVAVCLHVSSAILWTILGDNLYLTLDSVKNILDIQTFLDRSGLSLHANLANYVIVWTGLWCVKLSFMAFFYGLGRHIKAQRYLWTSVLIFIVASYFVCIGVLDYRCLSSTGLNIISVCASQKTTDYEYTGARITAVLDIVTDALIVVVSGNIVWRVQITRRKKLALGAICSLTIFIIVVAIVRITGPPDQTWILLWSSIEMTTAIFVACIASFRTLYIQHKSSQPAKIPSPVAHKPTELPPKHNIKFKPGGTPLINNISSTTNQTQLESRVSSEMFWANSEAPYPGRTR
ncbi:hypothetical protein F4680DRAFT_235602 [Xylaria scruposa]|nr:hypothetical protein F4680DRAFT_235602 [Xylaria scruposa]